MRIKSMIARLSVLACALFVSGYVAGDEVRMATHYQTVYGKVGESLKNPDNELDFVDIDWADIDSYAGEDFGEASFTVDKTTLPKWLKWESVTTKKDKNKRVGRDSNDTTWWYSDGGKYYPISGTPTEAGEWNVKVTAQWSDGVSETVTIKIVVKDIPRVVFDANGGKIGSQSKLTLACEGDEETGFTYVMPNDPVKSGGDFDGWWTAKEGGAQVQMGDEVDLSIFPNAKSPTLYAQWRKACKITVSGGFLDDETTSRSGLYRGEEVGVSIDENKLYDKNKNEVNAFVNWTYTPATADLGEGFDPFNSEVSVIMPNADVKLTANYVNGFAAYIYVYGYTEGAAGEGEFFWSADNGKTLLPLHLGCPVKAGKVTVKLYDKKGIWRASDITLTVDKRSTYKDGNVTYYDAPHEVYVDARLVPVNGSTKVKFDVNGGSGSWEEFLADGYEYGSLRTPERKGYVFAGWWTAKDGGEHVTADMVFDPVDFAGQKTPTLYAHWLQMKKLTMKDDSAYAGWYLEEETFENPELYQEIMNSLYLSNPEFDGGGYLEGKGVLEVLPGAKVYVVLNESTIVDKSGNELTFQKWTVSPSKVNLGPDFRVTSSDTEFIMPDSDVTFQATYIDESNCGRLSAQASASSIYLGYDEEEGDIYIDPPYEAFEWSPDAGATWYKVGGGSQWVDTSYWDDFYQEWIEDGYWEPRESEYALLKFGTYTVTWRSNDPNWQAPSDKTKVTVGGCVPCGYGGDATVSGSFTYVPQIVVDVMTIGGSSCEPSIAPGGTVTMNPKDGLVPSGKAITLSAKAAKDYAFQGWALAKYWEYGDWFKNTDATWKLENKTYGGVCGGGGSFLNQFIDPTDQKVHVVAVFKALSAYDAEDIEFMGFEGDETSSEVDDNGEITIKAVVGCAIDSGSGLELCCGPLASPLTYKLNGKLPDGLKFDAKTGILSGVPKKADNTSVTITATDPAKNSKGLTVNFEVSALPKWLVGEFRGSMSREGYSSGHWEWDDDAQDNIWVRDEYVPGRQEGILELSVKSDGKVSAKIITRVGTRSVSGALTWYPSDEDEGDNEGYFSFTAKMTTDDEECEVEFCSDGTITGYADSYDKAEDAYPGGDMEGMRQDTDLLKDCPFLDKYYTFAFSAETESDEETKTSGYGYLTIKTDKKGGAKVTGQLPDGEKVSMSALVMPFAYETTEGIGARLYLFASPSSYKKLDWFAMTLTIDQDGAIWCEDGAAWTPADFVGGGSSCGDYGQSLNVQVTGEGALYSAAASLENYYWVATCAYSDNVRQEYSYKESYQDCNGRTAYETVYEDAYAHDFDGYLFNVEVKGDKKGAISLAEKSPAPWVQNGEWNYREDKKGNPITDPSQLSFSFTKATGIFTGKALVYFDEPKPTTAPLPYSGVMIYDGKGYKGLGSAVHTYKYTDWDENDRAKTETKKVSLPVSLQKLADPMPYVGQGI